MAGSLTIDTLVDGSGNSTAATNCIQGSAKAWANFNSNGGTIAIRASYNISSITYTSTGYFTANLTNALSDANYSVVGSASVDSATAQFITFEPFTNASTGALVSPTSSSFVIATGQFSVGGKNPYYVMFSVFR
jgi:hypothetical protein